MFFLSLANFMQECYNKNVNQEINRHYAETTKEAFNYYDEIYFTP